MKIGVIGLGNIAQKAYLPIYAQMREKATFVLATRNLSVGQKLCEQYGWTEIVTNSEALIKKGITACFVHVSTSAHVSIVKQLLAANIHVCVDKPLSENLPEVKELLALANEKNLCLMIGFNRRFAPFVTELKKVQQKNMLIIQKNRIASLQPTKFVIYDLFLHVVDTAVYLLDDPIADVQSTVIEQDGYLKRAVLQIETAQTTALVTMNLCSGANTESYQIMSPTGTYLLENLTNYTIQTANKTEKKDFGDWVSTLEKRGFIPMVETFIDEVNGKQANDLRQEKILLSHKLCAEMVFKSENRYKKV